MRKSDYYCGKLKFYFAGLLKVYCVWKERAILCLEQERRISQQTHKKGFSVYAYFLGQQPPLISAVCEGETSLSIHCVFSETFRFVALLNLYFAVTKMRKSTWVLHPLYKSSLWNLKWPVRPLLPLYLHISLFALLFLKKTWGWWAGLVDQEVNPAGCWGKGAQHLFHPHLWILPSKNPKPGFRIWLWPEQPKGMVKLEGAAPASAGGSPLAAGLGWHWDPLLLRAGGRQGRAGVESSSRLISQMLLLIAVEFKWRKFGSVAKVCLLLEGNFLLSGAPLSAGRLAGRKHVSYLFLHGEGNELD